MKTRGITIGILLVVVAAAILAGGCGKGHRPSTSESSDVAPADVEATAPPPLGPAPP